MSALVAFACNMMVNVRTDGLVWGINCETHGKVW